MAYALMVMKQARPDAVNWQVYEMNDPAREPGDVVSTAGPLVGSVASWEELKNLATAHGLQVHQIEGDGLKEMEEQLGPMPE